MSKNKKNQNLLMIRFVNPETKKTEVMCLSEAHKAVGQGTAKTNIGTIPENETIYVPIGKSSVPERNLFMETKNDLPKETQKKYMLVPYWLKDKLDASKMITDLLKDDGKFISRKRRKGSYIVNPKFLEKAAHSKTGDPEFRKKLYLKIIGEPVNISQEEILEKVKLYGSPEEIAQLTGEESAPMAVSPAKDPRELSSN